MEKLLIKNLNLTISIIVLVLLVFFTIRIGLGTIFSSHRTATKKDYWALFKKYAQNEEE